MATQIEPIFGKIPTSATHWGCKRITANGPEKLSWAAPDADAESREWSLEELSSGALRERWGAGQYEALWFGYDKKTGARKALGHSPTVTVPAREAPPAPVVAAAPPPPRPQGGAPGLEALLQFHTVIQGVAQQQIDRDRMFVREMLEVTRGSTGAAAESALLPALQQIAATLTTITARLDALEGEEDEEDEGDDAGGPFSAEGGPLADQAKVAIANAAVEHGPSFVAAIGDFVKDFAAKKSAEAATAPTNGATAQA